MREIKFRAKGVDGEWWYSSLNPDSLIYRQVHLGKFFTLLQDGALLLETLGQYTGLKDKNGKEIYEGDILRFPDGEVVQVIWMEYPAAFSPMDSQQTSRVIGNIYENKELLEA